MTDDTTPDIEDARARRAAKVLRHQHYPDVADFVAAELIDDD